MDPGDIHVGYAHRYRNPAWVLVTGEWDPPTACDAVVHQMTVGRVDELVLEEFVLYEREYANQTGSDMKTPQLIGALKWIAHAFRIPVVEQGAYVKKPTAAQLRGRRIVRVAQGIHASDAELHLYHRWLRGAKV